MAPYFGNSLFVWGALIGVVLAGLSIGYWVGGILADRWPTPLAASSACSALGAAARARDPVRRRAGARADRRVGSRPAAEPARRGDRALRPAERRPRGRHADRRPAAAPTRSSASAAPPGGSSRSRPPAASPGTFATAFFLIPELGTDQLLARSARRAAAGRRRASRVVERLVVAAVAGARRRRRERRARRLARARAGRRRVAASQRAELVAALPAARERGPARRPGGGTGGLRRPSTARTRATTGSPSSTTTRRATSASTARSRAACSSNDPFATRFEYTDYFHLGLAYNPDARNVLFIGLGGGSAPKRIWRDFPALQLDVGRARPGRRRRRLPLLRRCRATRGSTSRSRTAGASSRSNDGRWDVIVLDAFYSDSIPFHLTTHEFLELARSRLAPGGVVVTNIIGALAGPESQLFRSIYGPTAPSSRPSPSTRSRRGRHEPSGVRNLIFVAGEGAAPSKDVPAGAVGRRPQHAPDGARPDAGDPRPRTTRPSRTSDVPVLTDDYAPTDALLLLFG